MKAQKKSTFRVAPTVGKRAPGRKAKAIVNVDADDSGEVLDSFVGFKMTAAELEELSEMAWKMRISRSELIRQLIAIGIKEVEKGGKDA